MSNMSNMAQQQSDQDHTSRVEQFLSKLIESLDQQNPTPTSPPLPQLTQQPRIIINGTPFGSRDQFQQLWISLPASNHQITSLDVHFLPSGNTRLGQFIVLAHMKVRFDESGKNKLGETALFNNSTVSSTRVLWSHWFGVTLSCVIDSSMLNNPNSECISCWDYRFTENPTKSIFKVE